MNDDLTKPWECHDGEPEHLVFLKDSLVNKSLYSSCMDYFRIIQYTAFTHGYDITLEKAAEIWDDHSVIHYCASFIGDSDLGNSEWAWYCIKDFFEEPETVEAEMNEYIKVDDEYKIDFNVGSSKGVVSTILDDKVEIPLSDNIKRQLDGILSKIQKDNLDKPVIMDYCKNIKIDIDFNVERIKKLDNKRALFRKLYLDHYKSSLLPANNDGLIVSQGQVDKARLVIKMDSSEADKLANCFLGNQIIERKDDVLSKLDKQEEERKEHLRNYSNLKGFKRFLLFAYNEYYPNGGFEDVVGTFNTPTELHAIIDSLEESKNIYNVADMQDLSYKEVFKENSKGLAFTNFHQFLSGDLTLEDKEAIFNAVNKYVLSKRDYDLIETLPHSYNYKLRKNLDELSYINALVKLNKKKPYRCTISSRNVIVPTKESR